MDCLSSFIQVLKVTLKLTMIQSRGLCALRLLLLMAEFLEFAMFIPLQIITPESSCLEGISLNNYKIICKIKTNKKILGKSNLSMHKMDSDGGNVTQRLYTCDSNYTLSKLIVIIGSRIYQEGKTYISLSSPTATDLLVGTRSRIDRIYIDIKIAINTKTNHMMVSFTDQYNVIACERLP